MGAAFNLVFCLAVICLSSVDGVSIEKDLSMTLSQKQALDKFREQVTPILPEDYMKTDIYLIRWLRAKNYNVNEAENMLKQNLRWREEKNMKNIQKENFDDMFRDAPATVDTYDKEGRPVGVLDISMWDIRNMQLGGRGPRLLRYMDFLMDNVTLQVFQQQQKGMNVTQWKVLANAENFNMVIHGCPICLPLWVQFLSSVENHFQGWMDEFIIIDAPSAVHTIFEMMKPFLSHQTSDAIKIFGQNKRQWMPYMDSKISRDERRANYGGTKP